MRKFGLFVLLSVLVGCGAEEDVAVQSGIVTPVNDPVFAGYVLAQPGVTYPEATRRWTEPNATGQSGDADAIHVGLGSTGCLGRVGSIQWIGGSHGIFVLYDSVQTNGTIVAGAVGGHEYQATLWTVNGGATMNFQVIDKTTGATAWQGSKAKPAGCSWVGDSARWLVERPIVAGTRRNLANFGMFHSTESFAFDQNFNVVGIGVGATQALTMVSGGHVLANISDITTEDGKSFWSIWSARQ